MVGSTWPDDPEQVRRNVAEAEICEVDVLQMLVDTTFGGRKWWRGFEHNKIFNCNTGWDNGDGALIGYNDFYYRVETKRRSWTGRCENFPATIFVGKTEYNRGKIEAGQAASLIVCTNQYVTAAVLFDMERKWGFCKPVFKEGVTVPNSDKKADQESLEIDKDHAYYIDLVRRVCYREPINTETRRLDRLCKDLGWKLPDDYIVGEP